MDKSLVNYTYSIIQTADKGFATVANIGGSMSFVKLDSLGNSCTPFVPGGIIANGGLITTSGGIVTGIDSGRMGSGGSLSTGSTITTICADTPTSVQEMQQNQNVNIYPIPSTGKVIFSLVGNGYQAINIYDELGGNIYKRTLFADKENSILEMDLSYCPNGVYIVQILKDTEVLTRKIIIQK